MDSAPTPTTPPTPTPPQTLRKLIAFLAFVCLVIDIVIASIRPDGSTALGHLLGIFLPDFLALTMFIKYVRNGLGRYPPMTRCILFTLLLIAGLMWPIVTFVDAGTAYTENGQYWVDYGLSRTTTTVDVEKAGDSKAGSDAAVDDGEDIEMAPGDQKMDEDKDFKNEYEPEAEHVGK
ncbi:hypothetical protein BG003_011486 [Podila horticola]|nr:hypothetical protein BG003_011486 [Podila horticola]